MQNKANLLKDKTNATLFPAKDYKNDPPRPTRKNKPNQTQSPRLQSKMKLEIEVSLATGSTAPNTALASVPRTSMRYSQCVNSSLFLMVKFIVRHSVWSCSASVSALTRTTSSCMIATVSAFDENRGAQVRPTGDLALLTPIGRL